MAFYRDDRYVTDAQGRALAGALVYYCTQPANTSTLPPSPLATVYTNSTGTVGTNPVLTDGFGHSVAYLANGQVYTVVISHPLFGANPVVLPDQISQGDQAGLFAGTLSGTLDGTNTIFTLTNNGTPISVTPTQLTVWVNFPLVPGVGYTLGPLAGQVTFTSAPQVGDTLYAQGVAF